MDATELRIPAKPQLWLWWLNAFIQLPLGAMMIKVAVADADGGSASRSLVGLLGVFCLALWGFSLHVLRRLRGEPLHVVVGAAHLEVPSMVRRASVVVPYVDIEKAKLQEIKANGVSFFQLAVTYRAEGKKKSVIIAQQLIGREALDQVVAALTARGVQV